MTGALVPFRDLADRHGLPAWMMFHYHQLRHAFRAQFPTPPALRADVVEELLAQESLHKPLSALYLTLLRTDSPKMEALWDKWRTDIPTLDKETWEEWFENSSQLVISSRDKLIQSKFCTGYTLRLKDCAEYTHRGPRIARAVSLLIVTIFICFGLALDSLVIGLP